MANSVHAAELEELRNAGCSLDLKRINAVSVNSCALVKRANAFASLRPLKNQYQAAWLLRAVTCLDLTTLSGSDTRTNVERLCHKAAHPIRRDLIEALGTEFEDIHVGAVCVYPSRVTDCKRVLQEIGCSHIPVAAVATGFPTGQYHLKTRLEEIRLAVADGATEIDIVINRPFVLAGNWEGLYKEVKEMREACGPAHMKTILATGELGTFTNVYKASLVCMMAGADFIKTSTGKEDVNAILPIGLIMARAIRDYHELTNFKVGFKPAGGIRTAKEALIWLTLMKEELGNEWLDRRLFRIGASGLLGDIERQLFHYVTGRYAAIHEFSSA